MNYKQLILIFTIGFGVISCQDVKKAPKPDKLISEKEMVNIMVDLLKLDATVSFNTNLYEKRDVKGREFIFEKYQIDSLQLAENNAYYAEQYNTIERIFDSVSARLKREKVILDTLISKSKDSLQLKREMNTAVHPIGIKNTDEEESEEVEVDSTEKKRNFFSKAFPKSKKDTDTISKDDFDLNTMSD